MPREPKYTYSETFFSIQGEGRYCGVPTVWLRLFGCNFRCSGFLQDNLDDPSTWVLDYEDLDASAYTSMQDLPVFKRGCDTSYSWAKKFRHLAQRRTAMEISEELRSLLPGSSFKHPKTGQDSHLAFTGGEPLLQQHAIVEVIASLDKSGDYPHFVTVETNGTQPLRSNFQHLLAQKFAEKGKEWFWSVSPKLRVSGEPWEAAIKPEIVASYVAASPHGQLKYVIDGDERTWAEVEEATDLYRGAGVDLPVYVMPVGGLIEDQQETAGRIADEAIARGYNLAARLQCYLYGNVIGT